MQSYHINTYSEPKGYQLGELPKPVIENDRDIIIKVHAGSVNPVDVKLASGVMKMVSPLQFPYKIGYDCAGTVSEVGSAVTRFKVGDEVYVRLKSPDRGSWSEYAKSTEDLASLKPTNTSFTEAASIPLAAMTALQALRLAGTLEGKTVFVPAGFGKNVFKAGKVITTVSTAKVPKVNELLGEGVVDRIIDYTKSDPKTTIPPGSVDFIFDTIGMAMPYLSLLRPKTGLVVSISLLPSGDQLAASGEISVPYILRQILNFVDAINRWRASWSGVNYQYLWLEPSGKDLEELKAIIEQGKLRPVVGTEVHYKDIDAVRAACSVVFNGKGGIGKTVISFE
ncbi:putative alcohol dehydrogenase [Talaromyces proteolyticus]|uniref:Alcohol dehydrogenase n=1 Tax=Talaromyces proteolyticus TaxID=1131652 RepID=A0AAD4Q1N7_9EURO|nr:putative alcohol dehydrogenase [Talaromyces proteolyticus]KAH8698685.1 putative alcohol dehydrogenase [Talaromyces proteolyticus]